MRVSNKENTTIKIPELNRESLLNLSDFSLSFYTKNSYGEQFTNGVFYDVYKESNKGILVAVTKSDLKKIVIPYYMHKLPEPYNKLNIKPLFGEQRFLNSIVIFRYVEKTYKRDEPVNLLEIYSEKLMYPVGQKCDLHVIDDVDKVIIANYIPCFIKFISNENYKLIKFMLDVYNRLTKIRDVKYFNCVAQLSEELFFSRGSKYKY